MMTTPENGRSPLAFCCHTQPYKHIGFTAKHTLVLIKYYTFTVHITFSQC